MVSGEQLCSSLVARLKPKVRKGPEEARITESWRVHWVAKYHEIFIYIYLSLTGKSSTNTCQNMYQYNILRMTYIQSHIHIIIHICIRTYDDIINNKCLIDISISIYIICICIYIYMCVCVSLSLSLSRSLSRCR